MSLDIHFYQKTICPNCHHVLGYGEEMYWKNITHNLTTMAKAVGFYDQLWRPEESNIKTAGDLAPHIAAGIKELESNREKYDSLSASNGWGTYDQFVPWLKELHQACLEFPDCVISVSR